MIYINVIILIIIITVVWDISGFMSDLSKIIYVKLNKGKMWMGQPLPKIISCSYCVKFHTVWIYLIIFNNIPIIYGLGIASLSTFLGIFIKNMLTKLNNKLNENKY